MTGLVLTEVSSGQTLDHITLVDGTLTYDSGRARDLFEGPRRFKPTLTDADLFTLMTDWSNGYFTIKPDTGQPPATA